MSKSNAACVRASIRSCLCFRLRKNNAQYAGAHFESLLQLDARGCVRAPALLSALGCAKSCIVVHTAGRSELGRIAASLPCVRVSPHASPCHSPQWSCTLLHAGVTGLRLYKTATNVWQLCHFVIGPDGATTVHPEVVYLWTS